MITDYDGNRQTAKAHARDVLMAALATAASRIYDARFGDAVIEKMTEREKAEVLRFIQQEADRCASLLGFVDCPQI